MHCSQCGAELLGEAKFCSKCGAPVPADVQPAELTGSPAGEVEPALRRVPSRRWKLGLLALSFAGILAGGGLFAWMILGGAGGNGEEAGTEGAVSPVGSPGQQVGTPSASAVQDFAREYIRHAIDDDQPWLREHTILAYYDFSLPWFQKLETCDALAVRKGPAEKDAQSSDWIAAVTFDPPCTPHHIVEVGTTLTLDFDAAITGTDLLAALSELGHPEAVVEETVDGAFIIRMGTLEGLADVPPVGPAPLSEREAIEQALEERFGDFRVLDSASFGTATPDESYACVLLRIESSEGMQATISRWFTDEGDCSPDSPWFARGFGEPSLGPSYLLLEADISALPYGADIDDAMEGVVSVIQRRADAFGVPVELRRQGSDRLAAVVQGIDPAGASELLGRTALLYFREPERDETGENVVCIDSAGGSLTVPADVVEAADGSHRPANLTTTVDSPEWHCIPPGFTAPAGTVNWVPARAIGSDGQEKALTGRFLRGKETEVIFDAAGRPFVQLKFSSEGGYLFEQITARLVGLPLGIFVDDELISTPVVQQVLGVDTVITGLDLNEAQMLGLQLRTGALPAPVRVIQESELVR